nr:hypothetical protein [Tanacetum cinerariifolium]
MESLSPQVVSTAKLPILNLNEFDLWKMRIEHYFLMTDYSLWEVILNGDSPAPTRIIEGAVQPVAPTTAEQRLARKNELKARDLEEQSLDDLFNSLKIYEAEVKSSFSACTSIQNIAFVSSQTTDNTNEAVSAVASVSVASAKIHVSALPNVDTLSNAMDLKWKMAMSTVRARRFLQRIGRNLEANGPTSIGFDISKVECYNCHMKGHFARECRSPKDTRRNVAAEPQIGYSKEEPTNYALMAFTSSSSSSSDNKLRDNALVVLRQKFEKAEQEKDEMKLKLEKFQTSSKNLSQLLASQTNDKTRLGYNTQVFTCFMFDCDEMITSQTDESLPASPIYDRYQSGDRSHVVPPPYTGTFMLPKPDLVFHDSPNVNETVHTAFNVELSLTKPDKDFFVQPPEQVKTPRPFVKPIETSIPAANQRTAIPKPKSNGNKRNRKACFVFKHVVPTTVLTNSKLVPITAARPVTIVVLKTHVTRPRPAKTVVTKPHSPPRRNLNRSLSPKASTFPLKVTTAKDPMVNVVKVNWVWKPKCPILDHVSRNTSASMTLKRFDYNDALGRSKCSRHMTWNMSYLSDFEELYGGYVSFGGNPKGGKISSKGKIRTGKLDFEDVYFVKELKFNLFSVS